MKSSFAFRLMLLVVGLLAAGGLHSNRSARAQPEAEPATPVSAHLPDDPRRAPAVAGFMRTDPAAARRWIEGQPDAAWRDQLVATGALILAEQDPDLAMQWLVEAMGSEEQMDVVALQIFDGWAARRPAQAAALADLLPAGALREQASDRIARHWLQANPGVAYIWMKGSAESERLLANLSGQP